MLTDVIHFGTSDKACREVYNLLVKHLYNKRGISYTFFVQIPIIDEYGNKKLFSNWARPENIDIIHWALHHVDREPPNLINVYDIAKAKQW